MWHIDIRFILVRVFYPCLMIFGTIGNILCLKILLRKRFRRQSTCQYLCVLAVIDILFIYMRCTRYLYKSVFDVDIRNTSLWICRIFIFFSSTLSHLASWILVIVSFDRYFIIKSLFARRHVGWRVFKSTCMLILIVFSVNLHYFHILGTHMNLSPASSRINMNISEENTRFVCMARAPFINFFRLYLPIFDLLFVAIIPFCLMIFTNIGIIRTTMRSNMLGTTSRRQQRNNRLTIMLLSVILAFMLLTCPSVIYICLNRITSPTTVSNTKLLVVDILEALWYTKHALNFILYTLSGQDFRREFIKLFSCYRRKTTNNQLQNQTNRIPIGITVVSNGTPLTNKKGIEQKLGQQNNRLSIVIDSRALHVKSSYDMSSTELDGHFGMLKSSSSAPTGSSFTSDRGRSTSTTRTSEH